MSLLEKDARNSCRILLDLLADHGIFVVPGGEVESWLPELCATGHGPDWLIEVFEKMGINPKDEDYVKPPSDEKVQGETALQGNGEPQSGDVWRLLEKIASWIQDETRRGMPE